MCDTVGWMKNGNFLKVGNPEKLKLENSDGYFLEFKITNINNLNGQINDQLRDYLLTIDGYKQIMYGSHLHGGIESEISENEKLFISQALYDLILSVKDYLTNIKICSIYNSQIKLKIMFKEENQAFLFNYFLQLNVSFLIKTKNPIYSEINLHLETLENILFSINDNSL